MHANMTVEYVIWNSAITIGGNALALNIHKRGCLAVSLQLALGLYAITITLYYSYITLIIQYRPMS